MKKYVSFSLCMISSITLASLGDANDAIEKYRKLSLDKKSLKNPQIESVFNTFYDVLKALTSQQMSMIQQLHQMQNQLNQMNKQVSAPETKTKKKPVQPTLGPGSLLGSGELKAPKKRPAPVKKQQSTFYGQLPTYTVSPQPKTPPVPPKPKWMLPQEPNK